MIALATTPAFAHPIDELEEWIDGWETEAVELGESDEWLDEWQDMAERHGCYFHDDCRIIVKNASSPRTSTWTGTVEQWRTLIALHFPNEIDTAMRIIACESGGNPNAKNGSSTAAGLWQFLRSTWDRAARSTGSPTYAQGGPYDPVWATINAAWLRARGSGWNQWECY